MPERLQKVIANAGVASRRAAEKLILAGKVKVNDQVVTTLGTKVKGDDVIAVNNKIITRQQEKRYFLLYKPREVICAAKDDKKRKVVVDLLPEVSERIYPVGRLDYDTSGLLLLTNDGKFANAMMHPKFKVNKTYRAKVHGIPTNDELEQLRHGVVINDSFGKQKRAYRKVKTAPAKAKIISANKQKNTAIINLTIHEGKNHQVKKMLAKVGHPVIKLMRQSYGFLDLDGLTSGQYRELSHNEVNRLLNLVQAGEIERF